MPYCVSMRQLRVSRLMWISQWLYLALILRLLRGTPSPCQIFKVNTNAVVDNSHGLVTLSMVVRDSQGSVLLCAIFKISNYVSPSHAGLRLSRLG